MKGLGIEQAYTVHKRRNNANFLKKRQEKVSNENKRNAGMQGFRKGSLSFESDTQEANSQS